MLFELENVNRQKIFLRDLYYLTKLYKILADTTKCCS